MVVLGLLFLAAAWLLPLSPAEQPDRVVTAGYDAAPSPASESVLLLRNGEMLRGRVSRSDDRFEVQVSGGEIYVRATEVQYECRNIQEAYQRKAALIRIDNAQDHLDLAHWCIKAGLLDSASQEVVAATALDPQHPLIPVRQRQLEVASAPPPKATGRKSNLAGPTPQELDRMVRGMPPRTVEVFSQVIQPMLVNNCSAAACHGQTVQNGFRLLRVPSESPPSRLLTQRNLHATLEWLDRDNPDSSPLLRFATQAHGAARVAIFTDRQVLQFRQLRDWCSRVCKADSGVALASYNEPVGTSQNPSSSRSASGAPHVAKRHHSASGGTGKDKDATMPAWDRSTVDLRGGSGNDGQNRNVHRGGAAQKSPASDPNDPESFNRQFSPANRSPSGAKSSLSSQSRGTPSAMANPDDDPSNDSPPSGGDR